MKFARNDMGEAAEASSARGRAPGEFVKLALLAIALVAGIYFLVSVIVDYSVSRISVETEKKIFGAAKPRDTAMDERSEKLVPILEKLASHPDVPDLNYRLFVLQHEDPNAFAFPGGRIGVTTGLLDLLEDEDDEIPIAFVIGHEIGHFYNRDHLRGLGRGIGTSICFAVIFGRGGEFLSGNTATLMQRKYSRGQEEKADRFGLALVHNAYGRTGGVTRLFEALMESDRIPGWAYMYLTHPRPGKRIEALEEYAEQLMSEPAVE